MHQQYDKYRTGQKRENYVTQYNYTINIIFTATIKQLLTISVWIRDLNFFNDGESRVNSGCLYLF